MKSNVNSLQAPPIVLTMTLVYIYYIILYSDSLEVSIMNRAKKINEKLLFVREFWMKLQRCEVEAFDVIYPVDATAILEDIKDCIGRIISENKFYYKQIGGVRNKLLNTYDLNYLIEEYNQYLQYTPFNETDLEPYLQSICTIFDSNNNYELFRHDASGATYTDLNIIENDIDFCLNRLKGNIGYFDDILDIIIKICKNGNRLSYDILNLKGYLTELYIFGIANRYSKEKLNDLFELIDFDKPAYCNINNLKYINQKVEEKEYTLIFEIKNLFVQFPIRWEDMVI